MQYKIYYEEIVYCKYLNKTCWSQGLHAIWHILFSLPNEYWCFSNVLLI